MLDDIRETPYYVDNIDLQDIDTLKARFQALIETEVNSVTDLETWIEEENLLDCEISEAMTGHFIDFYRDTESAEKRDIHLHDQTVVSQVLLEYKAKLNEKFCCCPFADQLDTDKYGRKLLLRRSESEIYCQENIPLTVREQELQVKYQEIMGDLTVEWDGEMKPYPSVGGLLSSSDRATRERAWMALAESRALVKPKVDEIMGELVKLRHQIALNAGFKNYRDYMFKVKNREYTVQNCQDFHMQSEKHLVPVWRRLIQASQSELGVDVCLPWDLASSSMVEAPFTDITEMMDGVQEMLGKTDSYFEDRFKHMRHNDLFDLGTRKGKGTGGFELPLRVSKNAFIFANFAPSFFAIMALVHEMGHAINAYLQFANGNDFNEDEIPAEVTELYSHGMELLLLDKLDIFYPEPSHCKQAQRQELRRSLTMLIGPLSGDIFQHWLYTHPDHTVEERDRKYLEICKRFIYDPVDVSGVEAGVVNSWFAEPHVVAMPFYHIEYSMSQLGALQLLKMYRQDSKTAIDFFKKGAGTDLNQSIARIYGDTRVQFNFSESLIRSTAEFLEKVITELK